MSQNKKIKVLRIIARLNVGGPAIHTVLLTDGLDRDKFESVLAAGKISPDEGDMQYYARQKNVIPVVITQLQREISPLKDLIAFIKIYRLIKKEKPDIIHTHTAKAGALGRPAGLLYNILNPKDKCLLIHTFHGTVLEGYFGRIKNKIFISIERFLGRYTDRIIVVGKIIKDELLKLGIGSQEKISVVSLGLELSRLLALAPPGKGQVFKVGIVGRLVPIKNHRLFLDAAALFLKTSGLSADSCRFFIIGNGELRKGLKEYVSSLGIGDFVEFSGWQDNVEQVYSCLDLVMLTSLNEGTPVSLIEAMSAARPVVATQVGGVSDLFIRTPMGQSCSEIASVAMLPRNDDDAGIHDNGILCGSNDAPALAQAINLLFANADLRVKMGRAGRAFVKERFSKERLIKDMEVLYNNCLTRRN